MISAIKRELMLTKIFQGGIAAIVFLGPIVISLIPYLRQYKIGRASCRERVSHQV